MDECPNCGADEANVIPVWDDGQTPYEDQPRYIACKQCHKIAETQLLRSEDAETPPQARLTKDERDWLAARDMVGNQNNEKLTIIEWQALKGAAIYYGVTDWRMKADSTLSLEENVSLMEQYGTQNNESTMRQLKSKVNHDATG